MCVAGTSSYIAGTRRSTPTIARSIRPWRAPKRIPEYDGEALSTLEAHWTHLILVTQ
jgi:hypothetical protein